ncbi:MAG: hypothetical protein V1779_04235 [bacterium]
MKAKSTKELNKQLNLISRFFHTTTETYDDWFWEGDDLEVILNDEVIERYRNNILKEIIPGFNDK